jgi:hypothetical protein
MGDGCMPAARRGSRPRRPRGYADAEAVFRGALESACGTLSSEIVAPAKSALGVDAITTGGRTIMAEDFEYVSHSRLEYHEGYRRAFLGEVPEPVVYGVQGKLREYYGAKEGPPIASTLDHIVAAVAG